MSSLESSIQFRSHLCMLILFQLVRKVLAEVAYIGVQTDDCHHDSEYNGIQHGAHALYNVATHHVLDLGF